MTENVREELYLHVAALRRKWRLPLYPVDPFEVIPLLPNVDLRDAALSTPGLNAFIVTAGNDGTAMIVLNRRRSPAQQRMDLAHELMHYALHKPSIQSRRYSSFAEWQADEGAGELLMPRQVILEEAANVRDALHTPGNIERFLRELSERFEVSGSMMAARTKSLRGDIMAVLNGSSPQDVPIRLTTDYPPMEVCPSLEDLRLFVNAGR